MGEWVRSGGERGDEWRRVEERGGKEGWVNE